MLQALGLPPGHCPDAWCLERPDVVAAVHRQYVEAGAQIVETNTFGATPVRLSRYGLQDKVREINLAAVRIAREAVEGRALVAGSMGPLGVLVEPLGDFSFDRAYEEFAAQAKAFGEARPDFIIIETIGDLNEIRAAILACKDHAPGVRIIAQMTLSPNGRTFTGTDPETAGLVLESLGADVIGFNCSVGPEALVSAVERMSRVARVPISVQPNAGMPIVKPDGGTTFPMGPEEFASYGPRLIAAGASIVGGCCGTTPGHIRSLRRAVGGLRLHQAHGPLGQAFGISSRTQSLFVGERRSSEGDSLARDPSEVSVPVVIGGRINASGREDLAADIKEGAFTLVKKEAKEQVAAGAQVVAVSVAAPGVDETAAMARAVRLIQRTVRVPVCISADSADALEAGLKAFVGKALVSWFSLEEGRAEAVLPLAKRYGAAVIGLTVAGKDTTSSAEHHLEIARRLVATAESYGIPRWDVVIDLALRGLQVQDILKTIRLIHDELGCRTCLGAADIPFDLSAAISAGLDMVMIDPTDERIMR